LLWISPTFGLTWLFVCCEERRRASSLLPLQPELRYPSDATPTCARKCMSAMPT